MMPVIAISTCAAYAPYTLPRLCASLKKAGVNEYVIVGDGFDEPTEVAGQIVQPAPVKGLWDLTALVYAATLPCDWVFLMGDTCEVDPDFKEKVTGWADWQYDLVGLRPGFVQCFIGLYQQAYLKENLSRIKRRSGITKRNLVYFEISGMMVNWAKMYRHAAGHVQEWDRQEDVYKVGRPRWHRYFSAFGVTKWTVSTDLAGIDEDRARVL